MSMFIVEKGTPGFSVGRSLDKTGWLCSDTAELVLDNVRLGPEALLGEQDKGFYALMKNLQTERIALAAMAVGPAHWSRLLRTRVVQHNLRTVAAYYQRIHTTRLADLVGLTRDELEEHLSEIAETSPEFIALSKGSTGRKSESKGGTGDHSDDPYP
jgi:acyl-CoA dehydrogenase